jgi:hypothetical protein
MTLGSHLHCPHSSVCLRSSKDELQLLKDYCGFVCGFLVWLLGLARRVLASYAWTKLCQALKSRGTLSDSVEFLLCTRVYFLLRSHRVPSDCDRDRSCFVAPNVRLICFASNSQWNWNGSSNCASSSCRLFHFARVPVCVGICGETGRRPALSPRMPRDLRIYRLPYARRMSA